MLPMLALRAARGSAWVRVNPDSFTPSLRSPRGRVSGASPENLQRRGQEWRPNEINVKEKEQ